MELPVVTILFLTKKVEGREHLPQRTIAAIKKHLKYDGYYYWFACDGTGEPSYLSWLKHLMGPNFQGTTTASLSPGANWSSGALAIFDKCPVYLRLEDDFELLEDLDITPYVKLLMEREDVGMVRLGLMPVGLDLHSTAHDGRIYFDVKKSTPYCFSGNPCLVHQRMHDAYGMFDENANPGEIEVIFDHRVRTTEGPAIWYPWDLGGHGRTYGVFAHQGDVQSY